MQYTWHTCRTPSVHVELMLNACCVSSDILVSVRIRSSHSTSYSCFNMQFDKANGQVGMQIIFGHAQAID